MRLGELIALAREIKGWTIRDLERECGVGNGVINQIETGHIKEPSFLKVVRICEALGLPIERAAECVSLKALKSALRKSTT